MTTLLSSAPAIASELASRLAQITVANGYVTNIGSKVFRGKRKIEDSAVPCAVLIEAEDMVEDRPGRLPAAQITQRYVLGGYEQCDPDNPNDMAHSIIRDIKRAVFPGDGNLGGKVRAVKYRGRDIGPRTDGQPIVFAVVEIDIEYVEDLTNP